MIASIVTALFLYGLLTAGTASNFLFIAGVLLLIGEIAFGTFWMVGFNGVLAIVVGYAIRTGDQSFLGFPIEWSTLFGIAFVELALLIGSVWVIIKNRRLKVTTGVESMVGQKATVINWSGTSGQVRIHGELWQAQSEQAIDVAPKGHVTVTAVEGLLLKVKA